MQALEYLHAMDYIHRDVKAGNILLTDNGTVKLGELLSQSITPCSMCHMFDLAKPSILLDNKYILHTCSSISLVCIENKGNLTNPLAFSLHTQLHVTYVIVCLL